MARYELTTPHFIEPELYPAGTILDYDGEPNEGMRPLDDEAQAALDKYFETKPKATINPVARLPMTMAVPKEDTSKAIPVVSPPKA